MIAHSPGSVTLDSLTACMNHLSPSLGGQMGRGAILIVMSNLLAFSYTDLIHVLVINLP
jgi:hypothetical protein